MRSRIRYAAITFLIASVPLVLMLLARRGEPGQQVEPLWQLFAYGVAEWYPWAIVAPFIDRRVRRSRPQSRADRARAMGGHAAIVGMPDVGRKFIGNVVCFPDLGKLGRSGLGIDGH